METVVNLLFVAFGILAAIAVVVVPCYLVIRGLRAVDRRAEVRNAERLRAEHARTQLKTPGRVERSFLKSCTHCGVFSITLPHRDSLGRTYCSEACMAWLGEGPRSFCKRCEFESTPQSSGNLQRINGIGTTLGGGSERCSTCRSEVRRVWFTVLYVPVVPMSKYRVIQASPQEFLSRRLRA